MSEIYSPGSIAGPQGAAGPAGSAAAITSLASATFPAISGNLFDSTKAVVGYIQSDGTLNPVAGWGSSALIFCPGATSMASNLPIFVAGGSNAYFALYDANGSFIETLPESNFSTTRDAAVYTPFPLPGTQAYVRFSWVNGDLGGNSSVASITQGMYSVSVGGSAAVPGTYQAPYCLDTVYDVDTKDAAVAANAAAALTSAMQGVGTAMELFSQTVLPLPNGSSRNGFDPSRAVNGMQVNTNGTLSAGSFDASTIFCPGATEFITNIPIRGIPNGAGVCLYDAQGNFIEDISTTTLAADFVTTNCLTPNVVYALPGTQTYMKFCYAPSNFNSYGFAASSGAAIFMAGTSVPSSLPQGLPFLGSGNVRVSTASQLGADPSGAADCTSLLNTFLAIASATNPVKLVLDGNFATTGLVISPNGCTTIEGIGAGSGITMISGTPQDGIRIGAYDAAFTASTTSGNATNAITSASSLFGLTAGMFVYGAGIPAGAYITYVNTSSNIISLSAAPTATASGVSLTAVVPVADSEGAYNVTAPARSATDIVLRNFTLNALGATAAAASQPVAGAAAHGTYGAILASCSNVTVDSVTFTQAAAYALCLSNVSFAKVVNCSFASTGTTHDGVHIDGPANDVGIDNCDFATGDDAIALNAPEGYGGDISRVTVTNCRFNGSLTVMRIYTSLDPAAMPTNNTHRVRNVAVSNCVGSVTSVCFNLGITNGGLSATTTPDQLHDLTVSNCSFIAPQGLALLLTPIGSLVFHGVTCVPSGAGALINGYFSSVGELVLDDVRVLRNGDGSSAIGAFVYVYSGVAMDQVKLVNCRAVDEEGSAYTAHTSLIDCNGTIAALHLDAIDLTHVAALFSSAGTAGITLLRGAGVLGTGTQVPDSIMDNNAIYLSSNDSGAPSIKVAGAAKRFTIA